MGITEITRNSRTEYAAREKTASRKEWELSDSLKERIIEYAKEDAAQNVYMGNSFLSLRKNEVAKVAPDRMALMGKINQAIDSGDMENMKKIKEADERWLSILFGTPYKAEFQSKGTGSAVHVYNENGEEILTYTGGVGWHEKETKAESEVHGTLKAVYYNAYHAARQEIKNRGLSESDAAETAVHDGFDVRA